MLPPHLSTPAEVVAHYDQVYFSLLNHGFHPFLYPQASVGALLVILYLLVDHRKSALWQWLRYPVFVSMAIWHGWCIFYTRARHPASALGVGLISSWGTLWVAAVMLWNDCQRDFKRIEFANRAVQPDGREPSGVVANGSPKSIGGLNGELRRRKDEKDDHASSSVGPALGKLYWQLYPTDSMLKRLDWIADVFCSFRGVGWDWHISNIPPPPYWVEAQLRGESVPAPVSEDDIKPVFTNSRTGIRRYASRRALIKDCAISLALGYIGLDIAKTIMHRDPYFWGYIESPAPQHLPLVLRESHFLTKSYRLVVSLFAIYTALWTIFKLGPMVFCGVLGPKWLGVRGEPWMNPPDQFGSFSTVLDSGLAGWWGGWWHQTFRLAFEAPTNSLLRRLGIDKRSPQGRIIGLVIAFTLSGCLHACGSHTQLGDTKPLTGPMLFFLLQAAGIVGQKLLVEALKLVSTVQRSPKAARQAANFVFVHVWLYLTAPLLVDDFTRGGIWLFEPIAFSPLRGLGLGAPDDRFFCWGHGLLLPWRGKTWWETGIAL